MKNMIFVLACIAFSSIFSSCGSKEEKKELTVCDCLEDGKVKQTDECREIAGSAKAGEIEKCK